MAMGRCDAIVQAGYVGSGGLLFLDPGTALFAAVAIFGSQAYVCTAGWGGGATVRVGPMSVGAGVGGRGASRCSGRSCVGCAQSGGGGVVRMGDGVVTFKGGTILNTKAVRALPLRFAPPASLVANTHALRCTLRTTVHAT